MHHSVTPRVDPGGRDQGKGLCMSDLWGMETRRNTRARTGKAISAVNEGDHGGHNIGPQKQHREWER